MAARWESRNLCVYVLRLVLRKILNILHVPFNFKVKIEMKLYHLAAVSSHKHENVVIIATLYFKPACMTLIFSLQQKNN